MPEKPCCMAVEGGESKDVCWLDLKTMAALTIESVPVILLFNRIETKFLKYVLLVGGKIYKYINKKEVNNHKLL